MNDLDYLSTYEDKADDDDDGDINRHQHAVLQAGSTKWKCSYLLVERPFEQCVTLAPHHHKEQGQVAPAPRPVTVQVDPQAHLVAVLTGVEGWRHKG